MGCLVSNNILYMFSKRGLLNFFILVAFFVTLFGLYQDYKTNYPITPVAFFQFDTAYIHDRINHVLPGRKMQYFSLKNQKNTYYNIFMYEIRKVDGQGFCDRAQIGDSVVKVPYSNILLLITSDGVHYYYIDRKNQPNG